MVHYAQFLVQTVANIKQYYCQIRGAILHQLVPVIQSTVHNLSSRTGPVLLSSCLILSNQFPTTGDTRSTRRRYAGDVNIATFCRSGLVWLVQTRPLLLSSRWHQPA